MMSDSNDEASAAPVPHGGAWIPAAGTRRVALPAWLPAHRLPPLRCAGAVLSDEDVIRLVRWLRTKETLAEALAALRDHSEAVSRDHFLRAVFDLWMEAGARGPERWALVITSAGGDACAAALGAACRRWAKNCDRVRANEALQLLSGIGSPAALMEISRTAESTKRASVRRRAEAALNDVATARGWSMDELEDRIVPGCGLDAGGSRVFDFGPRQFHAAIAGLATVRLVDPSGKLRDTLPKPAKSDDPVRAAAAAAEWKTFRSLLPGVLRHEARRMELAMGGQRRWSMDDFRCCIVEHPVLFLLARALLWSAFDESGGLVACFRIGEDRSFVSVEEREIRGSVATVSVTHPLLLTVAERDAWRAIFADYELLQPFDQMERLTAVLSTEEALGNEITRYHGTAIEALSDGLTQFGWRTSANLDWMSKTWPAAGVTALTSLDPPGLRYAGMNQIGPQEVMRLFFIAGCRGPGDLSMEELYPAAAFGDDSDEEADDAGQSDDTEETADEATTEPGYQLYFPLAEFFKTHPALPLNTVPPTVISDTLRDFETIRRRRLEAS